MRVHRFPRVPIGWPIDPSPRRRTRFPVRPFVHSTSAGAGREAMLVLQHGVRYAQGPITIEVDQ